MKRIFLVYSYYHHHGMVERLASELLAYGIESDCFCTDNYVLARHSAKRLPFICECFFWMLAHFSFCRRSGFFHNLFTGRLFGIIARQYDLVDFHVFTCNRIPLMKVCADEGVPFDITPWGSDVLRADPDAVSPMEYGFEKCRYIKAAANLQAVISERYGGRFDQKLRTVYWGNSDFEAIDSVGDDVVSDLIAKLHPSEGGCIVSVGYNAMQGQQHVRILECLGSLPDSVKSRISVLLQMTYPSEPEYVKSVSDAAESAGLNYTVFDRFLSNGTVAAIRKVSDVVINMQLTDAFSGSLQGHLYAGGVLIAGEWLDYPMLDAASVFYLKCSFESLQGIFVDVISHLDDYKARCSGNRSIMKNLTSWSAVTGKWAECYKA